LFISALPDIYSAKYLDIEYTVIRRRGSIDVGYILTCVVDFRLA
jgi:hypothetical protein